MRNHRQKKRTHDEVEEDDEEFRQSEEVD